MKIEDKLKGLPEKFIVLLVMPAEKLQEVTLQLLNILINKYKGGGYITINKPYQNMVKTLKTNNINERNIFFIDCITEYLRENNTITKNCSFVDSPANLTDIGIALDPLLKDNTHHFIMLDSLDTLTVYNNPESVVKFTHFLTGKLRIHDMSGAFLMLKERSDEKLIAELGQFCDKIITVD